MVTAVMITRTIIMTTTTTATVTSSLQHLQI